MVWRETHPPFSSTACTGCCRTCRPRPAGSDVLPAEVVISSAPR
ncbi:hypothetical protein QJS66_08630 [Kocuria rhizophila]|nr:hypothetical protein QJS66_08630 [Kocuria rhizophila]